MKFLMKLSIALMVFAVLALTSCNTVKGLGQDMQQGGKELQNAATKNQANSN